MNTMLQYTDPSPVLVYVWQKNLFIFSLYTLEVLKSLLSVEEEGERF